MVASLPGTEVLAATWSQHFADRYPLQHQQTLAWLRRALAQAAAQRDAGRQLSPAWLEERRTLLARCAGVHLASVAVAGGTLTPLPGGATGYRLELPSGVLFTGRCWEPTERPPRGAVVLAEPAPEQDRALIDAYRARGLRVIQPFLARVERSFAEEESDRKWWRFTDDEMLHLMAFIIGGSRAGLEAGELRTVVRHLANDPAGRPLPVALDGRGGLLLPGVIAAALQPDLFDLLVLDTGVAALDHQEEDVRVNTLWGFHRDFDALTLLAMAEQSDLLFVEPAPTPSSTFGRAVTWLTGDPRTGERQRVVTRSGSTAPDGVAAAVSAHLTTAHRQAEAPPALSSENRSGSASDDDRYRQALLSKLTFLERKQAEARRRREQRYALPGLTPDTYRQRVAESVRRVMGPELPEARDRRARTRLALERPAHVVYEVLLESVPGVETAGYLLVPRNRLPAPAIICQHGLSGRPDYLAGLEEQWIYDRLAERLSDKGYVTFAPFMNWGWGGTAGRDALVKHAYALGVTPNRFEVAQLHAIVDFLQSRPEVLAEQIAFYGLSYGGHASVWLPACEPRLAAVVTAGHFNDWQNKLTSTDITSPLVRPTSYPTVDEGYDMFTFNVLNELGHAEFVTRFAPRPYMVENGLRDTVTPTTWVDREFGRVQAVFAWMGAADAAELEHFDGPHRIWAEGTFRFLRRHLHGAAGG
jgi:hypothetical protein